MKKYGNDYRQNGKQFEYTGKWYEGKLSADQLKKHSVLYTGFMIAVLLIYAASLMLNNAGNRVLWVLLPYIVMIFPISYGIMGGVSLIRFCQRKNRGEKSQVLIPKEHADHMTRAEYEKGIRRTARCSVAVAGVSLFACLANLILIVRGNGNQTLGADILFEIAAVTILVLGSVTTAQSWQIKAKFTIFG